MGWDRIRAHITAYEALVLPLLLSYHTSIPAASSLSVWTDGSSDPSFSRYLPVWEVGGVLEVARVGGGWTDDLTDDKRTRRGEEDI